MKVQGQSKAISEVLQASSQSMAFMSCATYYGRTYTAPWRFIRSLALSSLIMRILEEKVENFICIAITTGRYMAPRRGNLAAYVTILLMNISYVTT
jgi:hypothetical protein